MNAISLRSLRRGYNQQQQQQKWKNCSRKFSYTIELYDTTLGMIFVRQAIVEC